MCPGKTRVTAASSLRIYIIIFPNYFPNAEPQKMDSQIMDLNQSVTPVGA